MIKKSWAEVKFELRVRWRMVQPLLAYFAEPFKWWHVPYLIWGLLWTGLTLIEIFKWMF